MSEMVQEEIRDVGTRNLGEKEMSHVRWRKEEEDIFWFWSKVEIERVDQPKTLSTWPNNMGFLIYMKNEDKKRLGCA